MINPVTKFFRRICHSKPDFKLITKTGRVDISLIDESKHWQIPSNAVAFDYVEIGKASDKKFSREVMTFFDDSGRMVSKIFRHNGKNVKLRLYKYLGDFKFITNMIFDASKIAKKVENSIYNTKGVWKKNFELKQIIRKLVHQKEYGKFPTLVSTKQINYIPKTGDIDSITLTRYPANNGFSLKTDKRLITGVFQNKNGFPFPKRIKYQNGNNIKFDLNDRFLKYRFFDLRTPEGIIAVTKGMLKEEGLGPLNIKVVPNSTEVAKSNIAYFNPNSGEIHFSEKVFKLNNSKIINIITNEIEHAKQHALIGRISKKTTPYEYEAFKTFGRILNPKTRKEALACYKESLRYQRGDSYFFNPLIIKAKEAGDLAEKEFNKFKNNSDFFKQFK